MLEHFRRWRMLCWTVLVRRRQTGAPDGLKGLFPGRGLGPPGKEGQEKGEEEREEGKRGVRGKSLGSRQGEGGWTQKGKEGKGTPVAFPCGGDLTHCS